MKPFIRSLLLVMGMVSSVAFAKDVPAGPKASPTSSEMETRVYVLPKDSWYSSMPTYEGQKGVAVDGSDEELSHSLKEFFQNAGVSFPPGTFARLNQKNSTMTIYNTASRLDAIEEMLGKMSSVGDVRRKFYIQRRIIKDKKK